MIIYYKVTGAGRTAPFYYACYRLEDAKYCSYSDNNSQFLLEFERVALRDIPAGANIKKAMLSCDDARLITIYNEAQLNN